jgi:hypothetical protein
MDSYIDNFAGSVARVLERPSREPNDFVSLAISGEQLRRACSVGDPNAAALAMVDRYERELSTFSVPTRDDLKAGISEAIADLEQYAASSSAARNVESGEAALLRLDELLSIGAAEVHGGFLPESELSSLATGLKELLRRIAPQCNELAQFAEDRQLLFGDDARLPHLYEWWEQLARLAPSRLALQATVAAAARRERRIAKAVADFEAAQSRPWLERLKDRLRALLPVSIVAPQHALQASYADATKLPDEHEEFISAEEFAVFRVGNTLVFKVAGEHQLEPVSVTSRGAHLRTETLDPTCFRIVLPPSDGIIESVVLLDGEQLVLPSIDLRIRQ